MNDPINRISKSTTNEKSFLVYFDPLFMRIKKRKSYFKIDTQAKINLENSIKRFENGR